VLEIWVDRARKPMGKAPGGSHAGAYVGT